MLKFQRVGILKGFQAKGDYLQFSAMLVMWLCVLAGWSNRKWLHGLMRRREDWAFIPAVETKEVEVHCQTCHGPMLSSAAAHFPPPHLPPIFIKRIHCLRQGFIPLSSCCSFDPTTARVSLSCTLAMRDGFTAPDMLVSVWDTRGKEDFAEKAIIECHKALAVLRSVVLQELLAGGTLPLAPRWWWFKTVTPCVFAKPQRN